MTEFLADGPDHHLRSWSCFCLSLFSTVDEWSGSSIDELHWFNSWRQDADDDASGFAKTFPDIPCVSQMLGGPSLRLGTPKEQLSIPSGIGWGGNDIGRLVTWEFPLRIDSASWNSFESLIQYISFCNSCIRPENSNIVFWSSTNFRLAIVSNVELWNFLNSSISVRLLWWVHVIPNFAAIIVLEEAVDLVVEVLQLERSEVLLVEIQQFYPILVSFFCRKWLEIRVG